MQNVNCPNYHMINRAQIYKHNITRPYLYEPSNVDYEHLNAVAKLDGMKEMLLNFHSLSIKNEQATKI